MAIGSPVEFLRQVRQEVGKVTWPTRRETAVTTGMVLLMVAATALFFFLVDFGLGRLVRLVLGIGS
jgi:preprotein translocase subunit SecE